MVFVVESADEVFFEILFLQLNLRLLQVVAGAVKRQTDNSNLKFYDSDVLDVSSERTYPVGNLPNI